MNALRTRTIIRKEWEEVFQTRIVLWTVLGTPVLFVAMAVGTLAMMGGLGDLSGEDADEIAQLAGQMCEGMDAAGCMHVYMGTIYLLMFMMLPAILPGVIAAYSVVGEKTGRTLEPLLATPVTSWELVIGKCVAAVVPSVLATWIGVAVYYAGIAVTAPPDVLWALTSPAWLLAVGALGPLIAVFAVQATILISSRVEDPRTAQQLGGLVVIPLVLVMTAQMMGFFLLETTLVAISVLVMLVVCAVTTWATVQLFDRENILTRWK